MKFSQNFDASINDELDKFMTPRDVRERMMMAQIPRTDKMDSGEKQNVEERQFQKILIIIIKNMVKMMG